MESEAHTEATCISEMATTTGLTPDPGDKVAVEVEIEDMFCFVVGVQSFPRRWLIRIYKNEYPFLEAN